jgi:hypothetical protein
MEIPKITKCLSEDSVSPPRDSNLGEVCRRGSVPRVLDSDRDLSSCSAFSYCNAV